MSTCIRQLFSAIQGDYKPFIKSILKINPELINERCGSKNYTPLHAACGSSGTTVTVKYLISLGADINAIDIQGYTPLRNACVNNLIGIVKVLIQSGAHVNVKNDKGLTPLFSACIFGHVAIARMLIRAGADINSSYYEDGSTPLDRVDFLLVEHFIEKCEQRKKIIETGKLLIRCGAQVHDLQDKELCEYIVYFENHLKTKRRWKIAASLMKTVSGLKRWHRRAQEALIWDSHPDNPNGYMQRTLLTWGK